MNDTATTASPSQWKGLYRTGAVSAFAMLAIMLAQIVIFILWPPPSTVEAFYDLFSQNEWLGLLSLDLLYLLNNTLLIFIYLALWAALSPRFRSAALIALVTGLVGIAAYFASNPCFEMLSLSRQYASAAGELQQAALLGAGQALFETYRGTVFDVYYVLNAISLLVFAVAMLRSSTFSKTTAVFGVIAGVLMSIPSTAGTIGLIFSLVSLIPWAVFSVMAGVRFLRLAKAG